MFSNVNVVDTTVPGERGEAIPPATKNALDGNGVVGSRVAGFENVYVVQKKPRIAPLMFHVVRDRRGVRRIETSPLFTSWMYAAMAPSASGGIVTSSGLDCAPADGAATTAAPATAPAPARARNPLRVLSLIRSPDRRKGPRPPA
jgi:hypothetical protein